MPRPFDPSERTEITKRLRKAGRCLFATQGVIKTTVEDLAGAAGIAKGSFYSFYTNKETLFFEILEGAQNRIREPLLAVPRTPDVNARRRLTTIVEGVLTTMDDDPYIRVLGQQRELEAVMRRVPETRLQKHQQDDRAFIRAVIDRWSIRSKPPTSDQVAANFTMLVLLSLQKEFFGTRLFPHARDAAISSFCDCFFDSA